MTDADRRQPARRLRPRARRRAPSAAEQPGPLGPHLRARGPDPVALRRRAAADHRHPTSATAGQAAPLRRAARRPRGSPGSGSGPASTTSGCRRRSSTRPTSAGCRCSRSRTRCRSSRSPSAPPRGSSTSSTRCSSAASQVHERLERLVIEGRGLEEILASTGAAVGGTALVLDRSGRELARQRQRLPSPGAEAIAALAAGDRRPRPPTRRRRPFAPEHGRARRPGARGPGSRAPRRRPGRLARGDLRARRRSATSSACARARRRSSSGSS